MKRSATFLCVLALPLGASALNGEGTSERDPFAPAYAEVPAPLSADPLRRYPLADLRLVATVHGVDCSRALIEDPTGLGFVIAAGHKIGAEGYTVLRVESGRILIRDLQRGREAGAVVLAMGSHTEGKL